MNDDYPNLNNYSQYQAIKQLGHLKKKLTTVKTAGNKSNVSLHQTY